MPPRFAYWTILIDGKPTAFRARDQQDLLPTLNQLKRTNKDVLLRWFARGKLWESPDAERASWRKPKASGGGAPRDKNEARGRDWRPGGRHQDPRQRFRDEKKRGNQERRSERHERRNAKPDVALREKPLRPESRKPWSGKRPENKPWSDKSAAQASKSVSSGERGRWSGKPRDRKPHDRKPYDRKPYDRKRSFGKPRNQKPWRDKPRAGEPRGHAVTEPRPDEAPRRVDESTPPPEKHESPEQPPPPEQIVIKPEPPERG